MQAELERLCELAETGAEVHQLATLRVRRTPRQRLTEVVDALLVQAEAVLLVPKFSQVSAGRV